MKKLLQIGWRPVAAIFILIGLWQLATQVFSIETWLLPAPTDIVREGIDVFPGFLTHLLATTQLSITGFIIGTSVGLLSATLLHLSPRMRETFYPFLILSQNLPVIVLAPLLVIWFGFGSLPKLIVITIGCFFPIAVSALGGFQQTNRELTYYMKMMGASKLQLFWKLELPHALPAIFSGLKIAGTYSVMAAVIAEWLGAQEGIGVFMTLASSSYQTPRVFVAIIVVMLLSLTVIGLITLLERRLIRW
ncbi:ABC transporter permease [Virgibacillus sp. NKC19-16]|uniref:ABC transporter permease n=1 Tax=Virgibacillus salidurans TaxID=2831673 RepID=UPI001F46568E|nr:ABC transporter permease [Virgibacillus sp. NKC19-16]UJL45948.1 ABC transporter permease [Virgibacillus sp. NKC19-16]